MQEINGTTTGNLTETLSLEPVSQIVQITFSPKLSSMLLLRLGLKVCTLIQHSLDIA